MSEETTSDMFIKSVDHGGKVAVVNTSSLVVKTSAQNVIQPQLKKSSPVLTQLTTAVGLVGNKAEEK